jgi:diaminohydroxyphosphoribosylaminopyrimidine deaminase/5-amino-6-(5-phosphoribosylamino)uracil reductase
MVYTGIVQEVGQAVFDELNILHVKVSAEFWSKDIHGDSIAVNGVCLTLLENTTTDIARFFVMEETRKLTNLVNVHTVSSDNVTFETHTLVNVEHSLRVGDSIGGHKVTGHVVGLARVSNVDPKDDGSKVIQFDLSAIPNFKSKIVYKGSICIDGMSLTVAYLKDAIFAVSFITYTQNHTIVKYYDVGRMVNIEFDTTLNDSGIANFDASSVNDTTFMNMAIAEGELGRYTSAPNPWVGSVIVKNNVVIGRGHHHKAGTPHAEIVAIKNAVDAGHDLAGSTIYVTLEPCCHQGRTGPCTSALLERKFARVVVGYVDPDFHVGGKGIQILRDAGIEVDIIPDQSSVKKSLEPYLHQRSVQKPFVIVKFAQSVDGKVACADESSQWISNESSRSHCHLNCRAKSQAIIVGSGTVLADNPALTVRDQSIVTDPDFKQPLKVVLDRRGRLNSNYKVCESNCIIYTSNANLKIDGVEIKPYTDLDSVLKDLATMGVIQVLVEGGSEIIGQFITDKLVNKIHIYTGAKIIGSSGKSGINTVLAGTITDAVDLKLDSVERIGDDVLSVYSVN